MATKKAVKKDLQPLVCGRRKCSVARVRVTPNGTGGKTINTAAIGKEMAKILT